MRAQQQRSEELEDPDQDDGLFDGQGLGANGGGERVGDIVGPDPESSEDGAERANDENPEKMPHSLGNKDSLVRHALHA